MVLKAAEAGQPSALPAEIPQNLEWMGIRLDMHIDTDEGNAAEIGPDAAGFLDSIQQRASVL